MDKAVKNLDNLSGTTSSIQVLQIITSTLKTYRNEEYGFEFQYSGDWKLVPGSFSSPFSKFNLVAALGRENYNPDPITTPFLINIVTPDFADRQFLGLKEYSREIFVDGVSGLRYDYLDQGLLSISIILPVKNYKIILGGNKKTRKL